MKYKIGIRIDLAGKFKKIASKAKNYLNTKGENEYMQPPHISLYIGAFPKNNFTNLCANFRGTLNYKPFEIFITNIKTSGDFYYLDLKFNKFLYTLHETTLHLANQLRNNLIRTKDQQRLTTGYYNKKQASYIKKYGYARILDLYLPHITLGKIENSADKKEILGNLKKILKPVLKKKIIIHEISIDLFDERDSNNALEKVRIRLEKKNYYQRYSAGGFVVHKNKVLLIKNIKRDFVGIPKGKMKPGETKTQAACREICEETGYCNLKLVKKLPSINYVYQLPKQKPIEQTIYQFMFKLKNTMKDPQKLDYHENIKPIWVDLVKAPSIATYQETKEVLQKIEKMKL